MIDEEVPDPPPAGNAPVPYERFAALAAERKALKSEVAELRPRIAALDAATKDAADARSALASAQVDFSDRLALHRHGIGDDEGQDVARMLYGRLPAEGRLPLADWVASLRAEGAAPPRALMPYLSGGSVGSVGATAQPPRPAAPSGTPPSAGGALTPAAITAAYEAVARNPRDSTAIARLNEIRALTK